jgi:pimeloyl-ACP methyl ester carboxylesterase
MGYRLIRLADSVVECHISGPADALDLLVFHVGSPSAAVPFPALTAAAARHGLRTLMYSRPGYGRSARLPGRRVADEALRTAALADHLGARSIHVAGWSGGGPAALACAALLPDRVRACLTLASPAPPLEVGAAWRTWYAPEHVREFEALASPEAVKLAPEFHEAAAAFARMTPRRLSRDERSEADRRTLVGDSGIGPMLTRSMRRAVAPGGWGWFDDSVARAIDWGFRVADIRIPVVIRHGELDAHVDVRQGRWLGASIPGAVVRFVPDAGHSAIADPISSVVDELVGAGRARPAV